MSARLKLIQRVPTGKAPPRALLWGLLNTLNRIARTGDRRYEFERLYLDHEDPWQYHSKPGELRKYQRTLDEILRWRRGRRQLLEIGCSVGVFTRLAAPHFDGVTAVDLSSEVLVRAARHNAGANDVQFVRGHLQSLRLPDRFDVIICAEMLCYIAAKDVAKACRALDRHLSGDGVIVTVNNPNLAHPGYLTSEEWEAALSGRFQPIFKADLADGQCLNDLIVYARRSQP